MINSCLNSMSSGPLPTLFLNWAILIWNPFTMTEAFAGCGNVIAFINAGQTTNVLQRYLSDLVVASTFSTLLISLIYSSVCPHLSCDVCRMGISTAMISWLENWMRGISTNVERCLVYILVFIILDHIQDNLTHFFLSLQKPVVAATIIIIDNNNNSSRGKEDDGGGGIAHNKSDLGLPNVS